MFTPGLDSVTEIVPLPGEFLSVLERNETAPRNPPAFKSGTTTSSIREIPRMLKLHTQKYKFSALLTLVIRDFRDRQIQACVGSACFQTRWKRCLGRTGVTALVPAVEQSIELTKW